MRLPAVGNCGNDRENGRQILCPAHGRHRHRHHEHHGRFAFTGRQWLPPRNDPARNDAVLGRLRVRRKGGDGHLRSLQILDLTEHRVRYRRNARHGDRAHLAGRAAALPIESGHAARTVDLVRHFEKPAARRVDGVDGIDEERRGLILANEADALAVRGPDEGRGRGATGTAILSNVQVRERAELPRLRAVGLGEHEEIVVRIALVSDKGELGAIRRIRRMGIAVAGIALAPQGEGGLPAIDVDRTALGRRVRVHELRVGDAAVLAGAYRKGRRRERNQQAQSQHHGTQRNSSHRRLPRAALLEMRSRPFRRIEIGEQNTTRVCEKSRRVPARHTKASSNITRTAVSDGTVRDHTRDSEPPPRA